jgi:hypothetical protein
VNALAGVRSVSVDPAIALRVVARDRLPDLLRDLRGAISREPPPRAGTRPQRSQPDQLGELPGRFQRVATAWTKSFGVIGRWAVTPDTRPAAQALEVGHHAARGSEVVGEAD